MRPEFIILLIIIPLIGAGGVCIRKIYALRSPGAVCQHSHDPGVSWLARMAVPFTDHAPAIQLYYRRLAFCGRHQPCFRRAELAGLCSDLYHFSAGAAICHRGTAL